MDPCVEGSEISVIASLSVLSTLNSGQEQSQRSRILGNDGPEKGCGPHRETQTHQKPPGMMVQRRGVGPHRETQSHQNPPGMMVQRRGVEPRRETQSHQNHPEFTSCRNR